jgi:hypothetical protein
VPRTINTIWRGLHIIPCPIRRARPVLGVTFSSQLFAHRPAYSNRVARVGGGFEVRRSVYGLVAGAMVEVVNVRGVVRRKALASLFR